MELQEQNEKDTIKDRRAQTARDNLKKARQARVEALQRQKDMKEKFFNLDDSSSDDSSDSSDSDEEPVLKIKNKNNNDKIKYPFEKNKNDNLKKEVDMLKNMMLKMASGGKIKRPRAKKEPSQKIIQIMPPSQPVKEEPKKIDENLEQHLKRKILNF